MEAIRQLVGAGEVCDSANRVRFLGPSQPAIEVAVHEPWRAGDLGTADARFVGRSVPIAGNRSVDGAGAVQARLAG